MKKTLLVYLKEKIFFIIIKLKPYPITLNKGRSSPSSHHYNPIQSYEELTNPSRILSNPIPHKAVQLAHPQPGASIGLLIRNE